MRPVQPVSGVDIDTLTAPKTEGDKANRAARNAVGFAVAGAALLAISYLVVAQAFVMGLGYSCGYMYCFVGPPLAAIFGMCAIVMGLQVVSAPRPVKPETGSHLYLAGAALALGIIDVVLVGLWVLGGYVRPSFHL